jgi:ATP-dependent DNA ligase
MRLPIEPPLEPQLARSEDAVPTDPGWSHERKWDGFRCVLFTDGDERFLQSRNGRPLDRYFPEVTPARGRYVLDGELVVFGEDGNENFEKLQERIHPAKSRVDRLAQETPARYVAFDLLALDDRSLLELPFAERRALLEEHLPDGAELTPLVATAAEADVWLQTAEGVISKDESAPYLPGKRAGMAKIKRVRTIDAVVIGWREHKHGGAGSLMLGLHRPDGEIQPIGHTSGWPRARARELEELVTPYETGETYDDGPNRWTSASGRQTAFRILRPELVAEVSFDHRSGGRIRHGARLERFRDDRDPDSCLLEQLDS